MGKFDGPKYVDAGELELGCLAILDEVAKRSAEYVITQDGKPVARLVPLETNDAKEVEVLEDLRSSVKILVDEGELFAPTAAVSGWNPSN